MTWTLILMLAGREMTSGPVDPYRCRLTELRIAAGRIGHYEGRRIIGALCLRREARPVIAGVPT